MTHISVDNLTIIGSDNGLSPGRRQAITWTNVGILLIGPLRTNFSEMLIEIHTFSFEKIYLKKSSGKWLPFCIDTNVLNLQVMSAGVRASLPLGSRHPNSSSNCFCTKNHQNIFQIFISSNMLILIRKFRNFYSNYLQQNSRSGSCSDRIQVVVHM